MNEILFYLLLHSSDLNGEYDTVLLASSLIWIKWWMRYCLLASSLIWIKWWMRYCFTCFFTHLNQMVNEILFYWLLHSSELNVEGDIVYWLLHSSELNGEWDIVLLASSLIWIKWWMRYCFTYFFTHLNQMVNEILFTGFFTHLN